MFTLMELNWIADYMYASLDCMWCQIRLSFSIYFVLETKMRKDIKLKTKKQTKNKCSFVHGRREIVDVPILMNTWFEACNPACANRIWPHSLHPKWARFCATRKKFTLVSTTTTTKSEKNNKITISTVAAAAEKKNKIVCTRLT